MSRPPPASVPSRHGLLPAILCSFLAVDLLALRLDWSERASFAFLAWNLFLAWAPYTLALLARALMVRGLDRPWLLAPLALGWLALFPNAPYLLTDFIHLRQRPVVPLWFDAVLLALFAATGWMLGLLSLAVWKRWLEERWGARAAWAFVGITSVLCGYGIYLGRVERWNSWDVLAEPQRLFAAMASHVRNPFAHPALPAVTLLFALLLPLSYAGFEALLTRLCRRRARLG
ncbi:DUF1361 domain-containing protein [Corallococcus sp. AB049A]|uniref:DUF1361 domain-containing protein n=1 Tax=Corallococcus interemptor TaxID=2316720 RepID=A0A3A8R162_9BACT|nr:MULTISPECIES: DUF1361 domain-containing protein [Corallococcus]RKH53597.1 DUF1361 domain-containing protein [Corallococcus sp. AB050B]RKH72495.1 DUF1361 domain-containing protein [Corallococcus interemptor]RKI72140.1 DUF1361 domain-containing protein [Corallococcus sp. AB049A]